MAAWGFDASLFPHQHPRSLYTSLFGSTGYRWRGAGFICSVYRLGLKEEHLDAWLNPDPKNLAAQYAILDDRARPYYEHQLAAAA